MPKPDPPTVSLLMPCLNEAASLTEVLGSVAAQDYPPARMTLIVVDGGSGDRSPEIVEAFQTQSALVVQRLNCPQTNIAAKLNQGLAAATGEIVLRLDAHTIYASDYVSRCVARLQENCGEAVGGRQEGAGRRPLSQAIACAFNHPFGAGNARYRVGAQAELVDTVYLGSWKRRTLLELGGWDESWEVNEDYELLTRLRQGGGRVYLDPAIRSSYFVRGSLPALARQYWRYGCWRVRTLVRHPASAQTRQFAAPLLLLGLLLSLALAPLTPLPLILLAGGYLIANFWASRQAAAGQVSRFLLLLLIFPLIHGAWGGGFFCGILRFGLPLKAVWTMTVSGLSGR